MYIEHKVTNKITHKRLNFSKHDEIMFTQEESQTHPVRCIRPWENLLLRHLLQSSPVLRALQYLSLYFFGDAGSE